MNEQKPETKLVGVITYLKLRNVIIEEQLNDGDTMLLNSEDFDNIVLEYRDEYKEEMSDPHQLLGIFIEESNEVYIGRNIVGIVKDDF